MPKSNQTSKSALAGYHTRNVTILSEDRTYVVSMKSEDIPRVKKLLKEYQRTGEWADEINDIIHRSKEVTTVGTINTMGDGGGWYKNDEV